METKEITLTPDKEVLLNHRNDFQKQYIDNVLDLQRHNVIREKDPKYQRQAQNGQYVGIEELIEKYRNAAANALSYVTIIDGLLKADEAGTLGEALDLITKAGAEKETATAE